VRVAIIGAGSWGTAVACLLGDKGVETVLWARSDAVAQGIQSSRHNPRYLLDLVIPDQVRATSDLDEAVSGASVIVMATPTHAVRETVVRLRSSIGADVAVVSLSKGLEQGTLLRMTEVLEEELGGQERLAALSGPNHAEEVSKEVPSTTVIASYDLALGRTLQDLFTTSTFRVYTNPDVLGVELCGASKNVVAVACGMSDGLGYGDNTKASLMTRGLAEMTRLGRRVGANPLTYMGLAGMGDLIATCTSQFSRNRALGELVAKGGTIKEFTTKTHMVAEGAKSAVALDDLAQRIGCELPITRQVRGILYEGRPPKDSVGVLMGREARDELHGLGLVEDGE